MSDAKWNELREEMRKSQEMRDARWGRVGDVPIAKFLSGECTPEDAETVVSAMVQYPELRMWVSMVRALL